MQPSEDNPEHPVRNITMKLFFIGFLLIFTGVIIVIIAAVLNGNSNVTGGLIIFVGPIPIILGSGPYAFYAILFAIMLTIVGFIIFFFLREKAF